MQRDRERMSGKERMTRKREDGKMKKREILGESTEAEKHRRELGNGFPSPHVVVSWDDGGKALPRASNASRCSQFGAF